MTQPEPTAPSSRVTLRSGLRVLQREPDVLQVGLDPARSVRLPATPAVRRTLTALGEGGPADACDAGVLDHLARSGVLAAPASGRPRISVRTSGVLPRSVRATLADLGLTADPTPVRDAAAADALLLVAAGEPRRDLLDDWVAQGLPHLVVRFSEGDAVVGPYVVPGVTACLRCVDAHHTDVDPRWPLLVEQQARQPVRPDGSPDHVDDLLVRIALAWAVRDLVTGTDARDEDPSALPATWSSTVRLPPTLSGFEATHWLRHPDCGCSLDVGAALPGDEAGAYPAA